MNTKNISISILLAATLGLFGCGGGGGTPAVNTKGDDNTGAPVIKDTTAPQFTNSDAINLNPTLEEGSTNLEIATIEATDDNGVTFSLSGADAKYFELVDTKVRAVYSTVLKFKDIPDYETSPTYKVNVNATDSEGNVATKEFTIDLVDKPFVFDIVGSMGNTQEFHEDNLTLSVKESKGSVNYTLPGGSVKFGNFEIKGDRLVFTAPAFNDTDASANRYTTTVTANDAGGGDPITVDISATVTKYAVEATVMLLKEKQEVINGRTITTTYIYTKSPDDNKSYLTGRTETGGVEDLNITYEYNDDYSIMRGYDENGENGRVLTNVRTFVAQADNDNPFTAEQRLSVSRDTHFFFHIADSARFNQDRKLTKFVKGLENKQAITERYTYDGTGAISKVESGFYKTGYDNAGNEVYIKESDFEALRDDNVTALPEFHTSVANLYEYNSNGDLSKIIYDELDDGIDTLEDKVRVAYANNLISNVDIYTAGIYYTYKSDGFIDQIEKPNDVIDKYIYSSDLETVEIKNGDNTLKTYIFEEE